MSRLGVVLSGFPTLAQMTPATLEHRIDDAGLIVEATVLESIPFWNRDKTRILTEHRLQVHKVFKSADSAIGALRARSKPFSSRVKTPFPISGYALVCRLL